MPTDYIWVIHTKKKILVTDDPGVPVAVCTSKAEIEAGRAPGYFGGHFDSIDERIAKVNELKEKHPAYYVDYESIFY